jgi:uncharacterized protein YecE (DUF72 family)
MTISNMPQPDQKKQQRRRGHTLKIYIGTSGYSYKEWKGGFYPPRIQPKEMLRFYSERFDAVEINNTFYHMPQPTILASWAEQVPDTFLFSVKAPQTITHLKQLRNVNSETEYLFRALPGLGTKLGPVLFQFARSFHVDHSVLQGFLSLIPQKASCTFEFRNPAHLDKETLSLLRARNFALCVSDAEDHPVDEIVDTAGWGYLRLRRAYYSDSELTGWVKRILSRDWDRAFIFFKHEEEASSPEMAIRFQEIIGSVQKQA